MLTAAKRQLKRIRLVSAALTAGEYGLRRALHGRHLEARPADLDPPWEDVLRVLREHGIAIVPGYWEPERCAAARASIDAFAAAHPERTWVDSTGADTRIYGMERVEPVVEPFFADAALHALAEAYWPTRLVNGFISAGRLEARPDNLGSGGQSWHRDGVTQQFKAILYLNDVGPDDGPFQYVKGTVSLGDRLRHVWRSDAVFRQQTWDDAGVAALERTDATSRVTACGPAGTLVLANTFGVHRGKPITAGPRYSLTNYYFARSTLGPVVDYYNAQVVQADGDRLSAEALAAR